MERAYNTRPVTRKKTVRWNEHKRSQNRARRTRYAKTAAAVLLVYIIYTIARPMPPIKVMVTPAVIPAQVRVKVPWPSSSPTESAAFGANDYGVLDTHGPDTPSPIASIAKIITVLAVLEKKPLKEGETGPQITLTERDEALYYQYAEQGAYVLPAYAGLALTERQALEAIIVASSNNIADTLAIWAFGSMEKYNEYANAMVKRWGMNQTTVTSASGLSDSTVSTSSDLIRLADIAVDNPTLAGIMNKTIAEYPEYGTIETTNPLLGTSGIKGIKGGVSDTGGAAYLVSAEVVVQNKAIVVFAAITGAPDLDRAMRDVLPLINSSPSQFQKVHVVRQDQVVGMATTPWGQNSEIISRSEVDAYPWIGTTISPTISTPPKRAPIKPGEQIGTLSVRFNKDTYASDLTVTEPIGKPNLWWRLTHPF
jgi:D-alanyl-D-alanine carboxypeptidase (penicillin-binding protein 5/6)